MDPLSERMSKVLQVIVDNYITTAMPVASVAVSRDKNLSVSPATIRSDMAFLEEHEFITRPHISSGSTPLDRGYRYFVNNVEMESPSSQDTRHISVALTGAGEDENWIDAGASSLARILRTLAFVMPPDREVSELKRVEIVKMEDFLLVLLLIFNEAMLCKKAVRLDRPITDRAIDYSRNRLNDLFAGMSPKQIMKKVRKYNLSDATHFETSFFPAIEEALSKLVKERSAKWRLQGISALFSQLELESGRHDLGKVAAVMENPEILIAPLAENQDSCVTVVIGGEHPDERVHSFSVIFCNYGDSDNYSGCVGIFAPKRLQYGRAVPMVRLAADLMGQKMSSMYV